MSAEGPVHDDEADRPLIELIRRAGDEYRPPPGWQAQVRARVAAEALQTPLAWWRRAAFTFAALFLVIAGAGGYLTYKNKKDLEAADARAAAERQREEEQARRDREFQLQLDNLLAELDANQKEQDAAREQLRAARSEEERKLAEARYAELRGQGEATKSRMVQMKRKKAEDAKAVSNACADSSDPLCGLK